MIIVKLSGGLGNQMFQYALGKHLAIKNNTCLKLDLSFFDTQNLRSYELNFFNLNDNVATKNDLSLFVLPEKPSVLNKLKFKFSNTFCNNKVLIEKDFSFDPSVLETSSGAYLDGYWQSEKYFKAIEPVIRDSFQIKAHIDKINESLISRINKTNSISLHVRRGDYVNVKSTNEIHGVCDLSYYTSAMDYFSDKVYNAFIYIFSDDIEWVKQNLKIPFAHHFVDNNYNNNNMDLLLMSKCKHHIIANSSFGWWGAWLNNNPNKIVVAPVKWFNDITKDTSDLIPENWIKL